jgi:hypothetical protein
MAICGHVIICGLLTFVLYSFLTLESLYCVSGLFPQIFNLIKAPHIRPESNWLWPSLRVIRYESYLFSAGFVKKPYHSLLEFIQVNVGYRCYIQRHNLRE